MKPHRAAAVLTAVALALPLAGCGTPTSPTLTVFAAASLTEVFTALGEQFEDAHPGVSVRFSFGGSSDLAAQVVEGAPADVFAAADAATMARVTDADLTTEAPTPFATNTLTIVTPSDNPARITDLDDLAGEDVSLVVCAPAVPCGAAAEKVAAAAALDLRPVSEEQTVKDVLAKVLAGEADAGLVYVTDVRAAGNSVRAIAFPESAAAVNQYAAVPLTDGDQQALAADFLDLLTGPAGQALLAAAGFGVLR